jgi:hypothetical protein
MKSMKGGIIRVGNQTPQQAFTQFMTGCTRVRILTDSSRSSITLHCSGCPPNQSSYRHTRMTEGFNQRSLNRRVTQCLIKLIMVSGDNTEPIVGRRYLSSNYRNDRGDFKIESANGIDQEVQRQHSIYMRSLFPITGAAGIAPPNQCVFSPVCPAVIGYATAIDNAAVTWLSNIINTRLQTRNPTPRPGENPATSARRHDAQILTEFFTHAVSLMPQGGGLGIVVMEFMDGCTTLDNFMLTANVGGPATPAQIQYAYQCVYMQLYRLGALGWWHQDCHPGNIMIDMTHLYSIVNGNIIHGNAFIIDYGIVTPTTPRWAPVARDRYPHLGAGTTLGNGFPHFNMPNTITMIANMYAYNRNFVLAAIAQMQDVPPVVNASYDAFVAYIMPIIGNQMNHMPRLNGGGRTSSENTNKKVRWDEFVDMIIDDIKPPVKFDLIGIPNKSLLNKSRYRQGSRKSPLNKSRYSQGSHKSRLNKSRRTRIPKSTHNSAR